MIESNRERQAPQTVENAEPTHLARYQFAAARIQDANRILDVPCGTGYGTHLLSGRARHVVGVDLGADAIEHANECFKAANTTFVVADAEKLSAVFPEPHSFDAVVSFEGIEHLRHPATFLMELKQQLKPDSTLIISTPRKPHGSPFHIIEFSLDEFRYILSAEFTIEAMYGQIYTDIFDLASRTEDPHAYPKFNFIAICHPK